MGFLAFLIFGGGSSLASFYLFPGKTPAKGSRFQRFARKIIIPILFGSFTSYALSTLGQALQWFRAGQIQEWLLAGLAAIIIGLLYRQAIR